MNGKLLQWFGLAALVGVGALAAAALVLVPARVKVVMGESEAERGPDRIATVEADVAGLREDLRSLAGGLEQGLGGLGESLDGLASQGETRAKAAHDTGARIDALQREVVALREDLGRARTELRDALVAQSAQLAHVTSESRSAPTVPVAAEPSVVASVETPEATAPEQAAVVAQAEPLADAVAESTPEPAPVAEASAGAKKRGFLSFKLPSDAFAFDKRTRFALVPSLSRVGFDAKSTLHDFSGVTSRVEGELVVCLARPGDGASGRVKVESASLDTGVAERDENMRTHLDATRFPALTFEWSAFEPESVDAAAQKVVGTARGKLSVHGVTRDFAMKVTAKVDASKRVTIQGQASLDLAEFGVEVPSKLGLIAMEKQVTIWIALAARPLGLAEEAEAVGGR